MSLVLMLPRIALLLALASALPARALAYETVLSGPLHQSPRGEVVAQLESALPSTITFRDATHAEVTFVARSFEMRGSVDIAEGSARVRAHDSNLVLSGSPFRIEVEPNIELPLVNGLRREVRMEGSMPIEGLDVTTLRLRVASEETTLRDAAALEACQPVYLWSAPRVNGPVIRTSSHAMSMHQPAPDAPGWSEVWVREQGIWLRGYTWEVARCGGSYGTLGHAGYVARHGYRATRVTLPAETRIAAHEGAPWTVLVHEAMEVEQGDAGDGQPFYRFAWDESAASVFGVVLR